jgi:hypothetical protein
MFQEIDLSYLVGRASEISYGLRGRTGTVRRARTHIIAHGAQMMHGATGV